MHLTDDLIRKNIFLKTLYHDTRLICNLHLRLYFLHQIGLCVFIRIHRYLEKHNFFDYQIIFSSISLQKFKE